MTGVQHLPFNTVFQLAAARGSAQLAAARTLLLIPDLLVHWLTGHRRRGDHQRLHHRAVRRGDRHVVGRAAGPAGHRRRPVRTGTAARRRRRDRCCRRSRGRPGCPTGTPVVTVASHDTASAVVAVPATGPDFAYISCGTWSLAGLELDAPVITEASRAANFTNERGIDGTFRFLRNIMGLWLLSETLRTWAAQGLPTELAPLLAQAARAEPFAALIDPDAPEFLAPGDMPARIAAYCERTGQRPPSGQGAGRPLHPGEPGAGPPARRCGAAAELAGRDIAAVHLVGGGSRNDLLCQLTADATGLPVVGRARPRRPRSATSWCRPARTGWSATWPTCAGWWRAPSTCGATVRTAARTRGPPPPPVSASADPPPARPLTPAPSTPPSPPIRNGVAAAPSPRVGRKSRPVHDLTSRRPRRSCRRAATRPSIRPKEPHARSPVSDVCE